MAEAGIENVYALVGGFRAWVYNRNPIEYSPPENVEEGNSAQIDKQE